MLTDEPLNDPFVSFVKPQPLEVVAHLGPPMETS